MKLTIWKSLTAIVSLAVCWGCGTALDPNKDDDDKKTYDVCKYTNEDGSTYDNCAYAVLEDGTCGETAIKVTSEKPANEYTCVSDL